MDVVRGCRDDVEVVEQPFGGGGHRLLPRVVGERNVDLAQCANVQPEPAQVRVAAAPATARRNREQRGQSSRVLFQQLDTEEFLAYPKNAGRREAGPTHELMLRLR
jgi:hypothetical protein